MTATNDTGGSAGKGRIRLSRVVLSLIASEPEDGRSEGDRLEAAIINLMRDSVRTDDKFDDLFMALAALHTELIHLRAMIVAMAGETSQEVSDALAHGEATAARRQLTRAAQVGIATEKAKARLETFRQWEREQAQMGQVVQTRPEPKSRETERER